MSKIKTSSAVIIGILLVSTIISFAYLDGRTAPWIRQDALPGDAKALMQYIGAFGHGTGCLVAVLLIGVLDIGRRREIKFVLSATILAGIVATLMKVLVHRSRPFYASTETGDPTLSEAVFNNAMQSFPSGHTATAFGLAVLLAALYPRGAKLFYSFAIITGLQRILCQAHYPSDVFAGAIIGLVSAWTVLHFKSRRQTRDENQVVSGSLQANLEPLKKCA